jgi:hypothetical protein
MWQPQIKGREDASINRAEDNSWTGQKQNTVHITDKVDGVKRVWNLSRRNARRDVRMCLMFRKMRLSQPRTVLVIELLK